MPYSCLGLPCAKQELGSTSLPSIALFPVFPIKTHMLCFPFHVTIWKSVIKIKPLLNLSWWNLFHCLTDLLTEHSNGNCEMMRWEITKQDQNCGIVWGLKHWGTRVRRLGWNVAILALLMNMNNNPKSKSTTKNESQKRALVLKCYIPCSWQTAEKIA